MKRTKRLRETKKEKERKSKRNRVIIAMTEC